jgi:hypothetical protein
MQLARIVSLFVPLAALALAACERYPPADDVAACAAKRLGTQKGVFSVATRSVSMLSSPEYAITYESKDTADRAVLIYSRTSGPISAEQQITYGNRKEITDVIDALRFCGQQR